MAEVIFLTGVEDKLPYTVRLLRKKQREGARISVLAPAALLQRLDQALWRDEPLAFLPHRRHQPGDALPTGMLRTQLWLVPRPVAELNCDTAVNLGFEDVDHLTGFARIAEIVGTDEADRLAGRQRWKRYDGLGHQLSHRAHAVRQGA